MRTKKKSFLGILLSLALIIGMMPAMGLNMTAYAKATLTVKGIPVTGENMSDVLNDGGTVSLDPGTNTLTLKGANITTVEDDGILYLGNEPLTIELAEGTESTINTTKVFAGIYDEADLIITGKGTLNIQSKYRGIYAGNNLTIENGTLNISITGEKDYDEAVIGIGAYGDIMIKGGTVNSDASAADSAPAAYGISSDSTVNGITIDGGSVNASGTGKEGYGLYSDQKPVSINGGKVIASGTRQAVERSVKNSIEGLGWTDTEGTQGQKIIPVSAKEQFLNEYKKVEFPKEAEKVTVKFDSAGGSAVAAQTIEKGAKATKPADPTRSGYTFDGWYNGSKAFDFNTAVNEDMTLTAHWKENVKPEPKPDPKPEPKPAKVSGTLMAKMTAKGKTKLAISWNKIKGAAGYDIFFAKCGKKVKKVKSIKGNKTFKWTKSGLKKGKTYLAAVKAYVMKDGKKKYVYKSPIMHAYTGNGNKKYTNAKSVKVKKAKVTLKKGKTFKIKAKVTKVKKSKKLMPKKHVATVRYLSTDKKIATVSSKGKIKAVAKGKCTIYAYAHNGVSRSIKVTVK